MKLNYLIPKQISMKRYLLLISLIFFVFSGTIFSQNAITGDGFSGGWDPFNDGNHIEYFTSSAGSSYKIELQANNTDNQYFRICVDWGTTETQHTITHSVDTEVFESQEITLNSGSTTNGAMYFDVSDVSHNYIFKTKDAGETPSYKLIVFKVEGDVRSVTDVLSDKSTIYPGQDMTITATLDGSFSTGQGVYLRYTDDSFTASTVVEMSGSGTTYTADIPGSINAASATINYYVFTSGSGLSITPSNSDWYTINLNNNSGSNYSYTVESAYTTKSGATTWSSISSWDAGFSPLTEQPVIIEDDLTLDTDVNVASLTINNGITFTASDGSKATRTLTIAADGFLTNNGTFDANQGIVELEGIADISGTISFYDIGISGKTDFGGSASVINNLTVRSGGYVFGDAPIYTENSNLIFATGGEFEIYDLTTIWDDGDVLGAGVPYNVIVTATDTLKIYHARNTIADFTVNEGAVVQQGNNAFTVGGNFINNGNYNFVNDAANLLTVNGDLTIGSSASLSLSNTAGGDLKVAGDFTDKGTFTHNNRAVFFNGNSQSIGGTSETSLGYVFIENDAHVTLAFDKDLNIDHDFSIGDGSKAAGSFKIQSTASGTGSLITHGAVPASIEVERYIEGWTNADDGWHLLSIPFESFSVASSSFEPGNNDDLYYYDEPTDMWINWKAGGSPNSDPGFDFDAGKGYLCSYEDDDTKSFSGTPNTTDVDVLDLTVEGSGTRTEAGWNMIGNPYPSAIQWAADWGTNINSIAKIYPGTGNYDDVLEGGIIPSAQAFFVQVTGATSLTIPTNSRVHNDSVWQKNTHSEIKTLCFKVSGNSNTLSDKTRIRFAEGATEDFDPPYDSFKLFGLASAPQLYTEAFNEAYSTNSFPQIGLDRVVDMDFIPGTSGEYQIEIVENTMQEEYEVFLEDTFNNITLNLSINNTYSFEANPGDDSNRFKIHFGATGIAEVQKESLQAYSSGDQLYILGEEGTAELSIFNLQGQQLMKEQVELNHQYSRSLSLQTGVYLVSLQTDKEIKTAKVLIK